MEEIYSKASVRFFLTRKASANLSWRASVSSTVGGGDMAWQGGGVTTARMALATRVGGSLTATSMGFGAARVPQITASAVRKDEACIIVVVLFCLTEVLLQHNIANSADRSRSTKASFLMCYFLAKPALHFHSGSFIFSLNGSCEQALIWQCFHGTSTSAAL